MGRLHMRPLQFWLSQRWDHSLLSIDRPVKVTSELRDALEIWTDTACLLQGVLLTSPSPDLYLFTDNSLKGWGASLSGQDVEGVWRESARCLDINHLELLAVKLALLHFREEVQVHTILFLCDNATAVAYLRKEGGTRSHALCLLSWKILNLWQVWGTRLLVRHIPSRFNVLADSLSRFKPLSTKWQLDPTLFSQLHRLLPTLSIDLFVTCRNTQLARYLSPFPD